MHYISSGENACGGRDDYLVIKASGRRFGSICADGFRGTMLPVRKCLTKKSGIWAYPLSWVKIGWFAVERLRPPVRAGRTCTVQKMSYL
jgi:hypothetical protein